MVFLYTDCDVGVLVCCAIFSFPDPFIDIRNGHLAIRVSVHCQSIQSSSNDHTGCGNGTSCSGSTVAGLVFYAVFSYLWTSQVIGNVALATLAGGAYGSEYSWATQLFSFSHAHHRLVLLRTSRTRTDGSVLLYATPSFMLICRLQPKHPTLSAFGRASTLSLGSIAFGSLIVAILEIVRLILNAARNNANAQGSCEYQSEFSLPYN